MKAHITIDLSDPMVLPFLGYVDSLPFAEIEKEEKSFEQAIKECNGIDSREFFAEVHRRINEHYDNLENA